MKITGVIEPGPKREVKPEYFSVVIENDVPVEWELDRDESGQIRWTPKAPSKLWNIEFKEACIKATENEQKYMEWVNGGCVGINPLPGPGMSYGKHRL